jgi:catalase (peroxidase I)
MMLSRSALLIGVVLLAVQDCCWAGCPFAAVGLRQRRSLQSVQDLDHQVISDRRSLLSYDLQAAETLAAVDWQPVKDDIKKMLTNSQGFWPADDGNYGPLMLRLAWHSAGTYRMWDGRGGVNGASCQNDDASSSTKRF